VDCSYSFAPFGILWLGAVALAMAAMLIAASGFTRRAPHSSRTRRATAALVLASVAAGPAVLAVATTIDWLAHGDPCDRIYRTPPSESDKAFIRQRLGVPSAVALTVAALAAILSLLPILRRMAGRVPTPSR
jgi:hypothetical protein